MKRYRALVVFACLIIVVDGGILAVRSRDRARPLSTAAAVTRFRAEAGTRAATSSTTSTMPVTSTAVRAIASAPRTDARAGAAPAPVTSPRPPEASLPAEGVYVYATSGSEYVDVLGGTRHQYPPETTITVKHEGCGMRDRWDALRARWDARGYCATERGLTVKEVVAHHEFYGRADERTFVCDAGAIANPRDAKPGETWTTVCRSDDAVGATQVGVIGYEELVIGGARVATFHFHSLTTLTGAQRGTQEYDDWMVRDTSLLVRRVSSGDVRSKSPIGTAHYQEHFELYLKSLAPRT